MATVGDEQYFVWDFKGYLKVLVYTKKFLTSERDGVALDGYYDCLSIQCPKART